MSQDTPDFHRELEKKRAKRYQEFTRRDWLKSTLLAGTGLLASVGYLSFEAQWLEVSEKEIMLKRLHPKTKLRLLHISDLHLSRAVSLSYIEKALKTGLDQAPDVCFITGDFITDKPDAAELIKFQKLLGFFAAKVPTFACLGNHDGGSWASKHGGFSTNQQVKSLLQSAKISVLENERREIYLKGQNIDLVGLGDFWSKECRPHSCLDRLSAPEKSPDRPFFLLNHNPDAKEALIEYRWDMMLAGHTHGGQFKVPLENHAPFAPVKDKSMIDGTFNWKGRIIHITRGVGNLYGMRLNCRPEICLLKISGIS
ncbi:MAG: phosphodiesterase YaeI [Opitutae bacterium]